MALLEVVLLLGVGLCSALSIIEPYETMSDPPGVFNNPYLDLLYDPYVKDSYGQVSPPSSGDTADPNSSGDTIALSPYFADLMGRTAPELPTLSAELEPPPPVCMDQETTCDPQARYRTISGRCNNLLNPRDGTPGQAMHLILPQHYDFPAVFRTRSARGGLLPNPRYLSLLLRNAPQRQQVAVNSLFAPLGQFIDHDLAISTVAKSAEGTKLDCSPCSSWHNPACVPIPIPVNDPFMDPYLQGTGQRRCLPVVRSVGYRTKDRLGRFTLFQPNMNTGFLDLSTIYGNDVCRAEELRLHKYGKLKSGPNELLMKRPASEFPRCFSEDGLCFYSGDRRANENVGLTAMHFLFHRAHDHLAEGLLAVNPHWDDEKLYQEARRINIAQWENIVYGEYLPTLLGYHTAAKKRLIPYHEGYSLEYDPTITPGVFNEFTTAAFRMGHSQVPNFFALMDEYYQVTQKVPLHVSFANASLLSQPGNFDPVLRGLLGVSLKSVDLNFVDGLSNNLFVERNKPHSAQDLFSLNTARGRDHGIAPYVDFLAECNVKEVYSFADLESLMPAETVALLEQAYDDVRDIDLSPGGLAEFLMPGSLVGPTFSCIIAKQFLNIKISDRFWFESPGGGFSYEQLQSIRQVTLASVLCDVMDQHDPLVPASAFFVPDQQSNPLRRCSTLPKVNLELWREAPHSPPAQCFHQGQSYQVGSVVPVSPCVICVCQPRGSMWCRCDASGCTQPPQDDCCQRACDHPIPQPPYLQ